MRQRGFSLVEMLVVIAIMGILLAIATPAFNTMMKDGAIESQTKELYADLMTVRSEAMFRKTDRSVNLTTANQISVYPTSDGSGTLLSQRTFSQTIASNNSTVLAFDPRGVASAAKTYCVGPDTNSAGVDSIIVSTTSIMIGKRSGGCDSAHIDPK